LYDFFGVVLAKNVANTTSEGYGFSQETVFYKKNALCCRIVDNGSEFM